MDRRGTSGLLLAAAVLSLGLALRRASPAEAAPAGLGEARAAWLAGDRDAARQRAEASLPPLRREVAARPSDPGPRLWLAEGLALAGEPGPALAEAERALALEPAPAGTRLDGAARGESPLETVALVALEAGDTPRAVAALERLAALGGALSPGSGLSDPRGWPGRPGGVADQRLAHTRP